MTAYGPTAVYLLCLLTSAVCAVLLLRAYLRDRSSLLLWTAVSFVFLALNNLALVVDEVILPATDLLLIRQITTILALGVLLYSFIWEIEP
jgi:hypothetical protein